MNRTAAILALALLVRAGAALASNRTVADVARYQKVGTHLLDVSWNPYQAPRLYPYPPVWMWAEAGAAAAARRLGPDAFPLLAKAPVVAADVALCGVLAAVQPWAGLAYAVHPVAVLVSAVHGQFDALALLPLVLACRFHASGRHDRAALALAAAIAVKSFPVLLLPLFLLAQAAGRVRFAALATLPVAALLLPFLLHDAPAVVRELGGYGGVADLGWIGTVRGVGWLATGELARSEARFWPLAVPAAKAAFLAADAALLGALATRRLRLDLASAVQAVLLGFLTLYGALSAQYLLWAVPLGLLAGPRGALLAWSACATAALSGLYLFLAPGVLVPAGAEPLGRHAAGVLWVAGGSATLAASAGWLLAVLRRGREAAA